VRASVGSLLLLPFNTDAAPPKLLMALSSLQNAKNNQMFQTYERWNN
jgi:hypothetical protein